LFTPQDIFSRYRLAIYEILVGHPPQSHLFFLGKIPMKLYLKTGFTMSEGQELEWPATGMHESYNASTQAESGLKK
jgi:hypothetical protein